ncbi:MAG: VWA domain-containing protein [Deltaproteobacteria bacterium]|nr:VWA domain-containing protein [Deltaproteobacteria bacterium]
MPRTTSMLLALLLGLCAADCRRGGTVTTVSGATAGWRAHPAGVAWAEPGTKYSTCPSGMCSTLAAAGTAPSCRESAAPLPPAPDPAGTAQSEGGTPGEQGEVAYGVESGGIYGDSDGDGILDSVDAAPGYYSQEFVVGLPDASGTVGGLAYGPPPPAPPPPPGYGYAVGAPALSSPSYVSAQTGYGESEWEPPACPAEELMVIVPEGPPDGAFEEPPENVGRGVEPGSLRAKTPQGEDAGEFPLKHTEVSAEISGYIARTVVEQQYENPFPEVIEAVYVFPLPSLAAVNDFVMEIGSRKIIGLIRPREEAERIYAEARARGQTASLLTQERPNIFTQSVANIEPGGQVNIKITFFERLSYERGRYEWVFPMVVGPRYIPGDAQPPAAAAGDSPPSTAPSGAGPSTGPGQGGWSPPTDRVPDADGITPPVLAPGQRSGHDIGLTVKLDAGLPIRELTSVAHCVDVDVVSETEGVVKLSDADAIPNRDFVLRWSVAGEETQFGVLATRGDQGGFLTMMMQPPEAPTDAQVTPREITFLIDVSGSQSGLPIGISKEVVHRAIEGLRPDDLFNVFYFADGNGQLWDEAQPRTAGNVEEAQDFVGSLCGGGGTEMLEGIRRALEAEHDPKYLQMFVFLTDGYVGNEDEILRMVKEERGEARFFVFGIGSGVNRYLLDGIAEFGGGASHEVLPRDEQHAGRAVETLFDMIDSPVLVDVRIDWNGLPVTDVYPSKLPDLFAGQTINVLARYTAPARGTAYIEARVGDQRLRVPVDVDLPETEPANEALAPIWARWRIDELSDEELSADENAKAELKRQITELALDFRLVSQYTAFVAVDESRVVGDGSPLRVLQPVELPEGVSYEGVFGEAAIGLPVDVPLWGLTLQTGRSGAVRVGAVYVGGPAAQAGIAAGATLRTVNGTLVNDLRHLEGLLLQAGGSIVLVGFEPGGEVELPME